MKENNNVFVVIIIFLAVLLALSIGFSVYYVLEGNKLNSNNNIEEKEQPEAEPEAEEVDMTNELKEVIQKRLVELYGLVDEYGDLKSSSDINTKLDNQTKLKFVNKLYGLNNEIDVEKHIKEMFGSDMTIIHEDIKCLSDDAEYFFRYDLQNKKYQKNENGCYDIGLTFGDNEYLISSIKFNAKTNLYTVVANVQYYGKTSNDTYGPLKSDLYEDYSRKKTIDVSDIKAEYEKEYNSGDEVNYYAEIFEVYKDRIPQGTFTFEKVNDTYALVGVEISKGE